MSNPRPMSPAEARRFLRDKESQTEKPCRACKELVRPGAYKCPHCHALFPLQTDKDATRTFLLRFIVAFVIVTVFVMVMARCEMQAMLDTFK